MILIPCRKAFNPFFEEIRTYSHYKFIYGSLHSSIKQCKIILIHWPELLFDWKEPTDSQLVELNKIFQGWKRHCQILYVVHNNERHLGMTKNFKLLYDIVYNNCDLMVHFGNFSYKIFKKDFPNKKHKIISHPLYKNFYKLSTKSHSRDKLKISKDSFVVVVPGTVRNLEERKLILNAFNSLKIKNKLLIAPRMYRFKSNIEFRGRYRLRKIVDIKSIIEALYNINISKNYIFDNRLLSYDEISDYMSCSDIVLIPRYTSLNSGILYLGLSFKKIIVGPGIGNIKEVLETFNMPIFNPMDSESIERAMELSINSNELEYNAEYYKNELIKLHPKTIANQWDILIKNLIEDCSTI